MRKWLPLLLLATLATPLGGPHAQIAASELIHVKGTVVSQEPSRSAWLLELDRGVDTASGRLRSVALVVDENRRPAHPISVGDRLEAEGRFRVPGVLG